VIAEVKQKPLRRDIIQKKILGMISEMKLQPGDRLISEKKLAEQLGVNHLTLRAAFAELSEKGVLERRPGSGTYIKRVFGLEPENNIFQGSKTRTVAVAMRDDPHFYSGLKNDIILQLERNGMVPIAVGHEGNFSHENMEQLLKLNSMGVDLLVIDQSPAVDNQQNIEFLQAHGADFKTIVRVLGNQQFGDDLPGSMVSGDYADAYNVAIAHLKELGHRKIGFSCGTLTEDNSAWCANRRYAELYSQAMLNNNLANEIKICTAREKEGVKRITEELINIGYSAIFCDIDYRAVVALETAVGLGLKVPEDLSIMGFFDTPWAEHYNITTFKYRNMEIAETVIKCLNEPDTVPVVNLKKIDFIERATTGVKKAVLSENNVNEKVLLASNF
jgi:DNA-binding LacI/PurR family transcriptional regulator